MNDREKLRVLIPHWIEHNEEHAVEFEQWAENVPQFATDLRGAAEAMRVVSQLLAVSLEKMGGALQHSHDHNDHHSH